MEGCTEDQYMRVVGEGRGVHKASIWSVWLVEGCTDG